MTRTLTTFRGAAGFDATADKVKVHEAFMGSDGTAPFEGVIGLEGMLTGDGRLIQEQSLSWAQFPLPLRWAPADFGAHDGALVVGRIDRIERRDNGDIYAWGVLDLGSKEGRECARLMRGQFLSGVSMDLDSVDSFEAEVQMFDAEGNPQGEVGDRPNVLVTSEARVRAATLVAIPAFDEARLALVASIGSSPGIMVGHGAFSLTFADDAADRAAFRAGAARQWKTQQDRIAALAAATAEFAPRTRLFNELAAARQAFAGNLGYLKQWRNPDNGKWIDMPGEAIRKLIEAFKGDGRFKQDELTESRSRAEKADAAIQSGDIAAAQLEASEALYALNRSMPSSADDYELNNDPTVEATRDAFIAVENANAFDTGDTAQVDVGDVEGADFDDPGFDDEPLVSPDDPANNPSTAKTGGDTGIQATLNELDGMPNRGAGAWVRINDPDLRDGSGVFEYDDVDDEFVNTDGDGTSFLASNKNVAALEKRGGSIDILGWPDGDGGYTPAPPGAAKDSIDAGGLGESGTGLSEVERTSLQSYLEGITDDELQSHYDKTAKLRGDKPSGKGLQLKLDDELALAGDELVKRGLETNESLEERTLGPRPSGDSDATDKRLAEINAAQETATGDEWEKLQKEAEALMAGAEGAPGKVAEALPAGTPIFNTGMDAESQQVSYVVGENGSLIASDENGEVDYGVPVPDPATGAAAMDAVGLRADDLQEDEVWEGMRDDGTLVAVVKHGGTLYVGEGKLDDPANHEIDADVAAQAVAEGKTGPAPAGVGDSTPSDASAALDAALGKAEGMAPPDDYEGSADDWAEGIEAIGAGLQAGDPAGMQQASDTAWGMNLQDLGVAIDAVRGTSATGGDPADAPPLPNDAPPLPNDAPGDSGNYSGLDDATLLNAAAVLMDNLLTAPTPSFRDVVTAELGDAQAEVRKRGLTMPSGTDDLVPGTGGLNAEQTATVDAGLQAMNPLAEETAPLPATDKEIMAEGDGIDLDERATWDPTEWGGAAYDEVVFDAEGIGNEVRKLPNWENVSDEGVQRYVEDRRRYWEAAARTEPAKDNEKGVPMRLLPTGSEVHVPAAVGRAYYRKVGAPLANGNTNPDGTPEIVGKWWDGYQWDFVGGSTLFETGRIPVGKAPDKKWKAENDKAAAIAQARADYAEAHAADPGTPLPVNDTPDGPDAMLDAEEAEHRGRVGNPPGTGIISPEDVGEGAPNNGGIPTAPNGETRKAAMQPLIGETVTVHDPNDGPFEVVVKDVRGTGDAGPYKTLDSAAETARKYPASIQTPEGNWIPLSMVEAGTLVTPAASPPGTGKVSPEDTGEEAEAAIEALAANIGDLSRGNIPEDQLPAYDEMMELIGGLADGVVDLTARNDARNAIEQIIGNSVGDYLAPSERQDLESLYEALSGKDAINQEVANPASNNVPTPGTAPDDGPDATLTGMGWRADNSNPTTAWRSPSGLDVIEQQDDGSFVAAKSSSADPKDPLQKTFPTLQEALTYIDDDGAGGSRGGAPNPSAPTGRGNLTDAMAEVDTVPAGWTVSPPDATKNYLEVSGPNGERITWHSSSGWVTVAPNGQPTGFFGSFAEALASFRGESAGDGSLGTGAYSGKGPMTGTIAPENIDTANQYLQSDDMTKYLDEPLKSKVSNIVWSVTPDGANIQVDLTLTDTLTPEERAELEDFISGQNSDGLGEGFEQQDWAWEEGDPEDPYLNNDEVDEDADEGHMISMPWDVKINDDGTVTLGNPGGQGFATAAPATTRADTNPFADTSVPIPWSRATREDDSLGLSRVTYRVPGWSGMIRQDGRPSQPFTVYWEGSEDGDTYLARSLSDAKAEVEGLLRRNGGKWTAKVSTFASTFAARRAERTGVLADEDCGCDELAEGGVQTFAEAAVEQVAETWRNIDGTHVPLPGVRLTELLTALAGIQVPVGSVERARAYTDQLDTALIDSAWEVVNRLTPDFYSNTGSLFQAYLNTTGTEKFPTAQEAFEALEASIETAAETAAELALDADSIVPDDENPAGGPADSPLTPDEIVDEIAEGDPELGPNDAGAAELPALPVIEVVAPAAAQLNSVTNAGRTVTTAYNWVEETGGLPRYIRRIADHLIERGMTESHAIASAVNTVKRWSRGGGDVKPDTIAKALAALAEWEANRIEAHATSAQSVTFAVIEAPVKPAFVEGFDTLEGVAGGQDLVNDISAVSSAVLTVANDVAEAVGLLPEGTRAENGHDLGADVDDLAYLAAQVEATSRKVAGSLVASAGGTYAAPIAPPKAWFANPNLKTATPVTVTKEGHIYGHLATWDSCHMESKGLGTTCTRAPKSRSGYALFHTGYVTTDDGTDVPTGRIVAGAPHADPVWGLNPTLVHYSHSGWVGADVRVGEDAYGIWVSGAIRPDVSPAQLRALKAAPLSGDWREDPKTGQLELVAGLGVTVPGFMPRPRGLVASAGSVLSMQAVGMVAPSIVIPPGKDGAFSIEDLRYLQERAVAGKAWAAEATKVAEFARARAVDNIAAFARERKMAEMAADVKGMR